MEFLAQIIWNLHLKKQNFNPDGFFSIWDRKKWKEMEVSDFYEKTENMSEFVPIKSEKTGKGRKKQIKLRIDSDHNEKTEIKSEPVPTLLGKTVNGRKNGVGFTIISD